VSAHRSYDVVVVGGGPVGCAAALAFARKGRSVLVLEANPSACKRLAGEWLHPPAVQALKSLGVELPWGGPPYATGQGFVVVPEDGTEPMVLPYASGHTGFGIEHERLVTALREALVGAGVTYVPWARVQSIEGDRVTWAVKGGGGDTVVAGRVIGADGRGSVVRASLGLGGDMETKSRMAGVILHGATLPREGFGHVLLGGPGPILSYRIAPDEVRLCIDVPTASFERGDPAGFLREHYTRALPEGLRAPFHEALDAGRVVWAANQVRPRLEFGTAERTLIGDAVGHYHPFTAVGMTFGFTDAVRLAEVPFDAWKRERAAWTRVPELLAVGLYDVFADPSEVAQAMRQVVYTTWRTNPIEASRTMRYLACEDTRVSVFGWSFTATLLKAGVRLVGEAARTGAWWRTATMGRDMAARFGWIAAGAFRLGTTTALQGTTADSTARS